MKRIVVFLFIMMFLSIATTANAVPYNVAEGAAVTLNGKFFSGGWCCGDVPANQQARADTLVDGIFLPRSTQWDKGTVWWDANNCCSKNKDINNDLKCCSKNNYINIDLGGVFTIESFVVQADDNDGYILDYWDGDSWKLAWDIPNYDAYGWGMQTRPNPKDNDERYILPSVIVTDALRFSGDLNDGDRLFSVSEIQAYGAPIPEPATVLLLGSGLVGLAVLKRKFKVKG